MTDAVVDAIVTVTLVGFMTVCHIGALIAAVVFFVALIGGGDDASINTEVSDDASA